MTDHNDHATRAARFRDLNLRGRLLLPNAWDAATARVFEQAGFPAIGTTSGGIANARGIPDGERIGRDAMLRELECIAGAVDTPVSADIEAGYGDAPADVAATVEAVLDIGIAGVNLEDNCHGRGALAFSRGVRFARPALVNGAVGVVVAPRGRLFRVLSFTLERGKIATIDVIADAERLRQLELAVLNDR